MRRFWIAACFTIALVALMYPFAAPRNPGNPRTMQIPQQNPHNAWHEVSMKQAILSQDLKRTDELCRTQCTLDFKLTMTEIAGRSAQEIPAALRKMQADHRHIDYVRWIKGSSEVASGSLQKALKPKVAAELEQAKRKALKRELYHSKAIKHDGQTYFVLGVPASTGKSAMVGVVHQQILAKVEAHQRKNLRLVPYPREGKPKIESVDPNTNRDITVQSGEDNGNASHYHINEVVVRFRNAPTDAELEQMKAEIGTKQVKKLGYTYVFHSKTMDANAMMKYFSKWNPIYIEPHYYYMTNENAPNDTLYSKYQWNLPIIETEKGWDLSKGSGNVLVAVIDTGVDLNHSDLKDHLVGGYNVINKSTQPTDDVGHGTHVAGVISALVNNGEGVAGMTWYNKVMPVKALDSSGAGTTYTVAEGIIWATDHGAKVINMSLGNYAEAQFLHDAIKYAYDRDVVLVAASGNDNTDRPGYPAAYPEVFAVAATDSNKNKAPFSNYGDYVDVAAPGVSIASTYPTNDYAALSGTSMASPHVAALAALIRSINPNLKNTEVMDIMRKSAIDLGAPGKDPNFGYGQIDVVKALQMAEQNVASLGNWKDNLQRRLNYAINQFRR